VKHHKTQTMFHMKHKDKGFVLYLLNKI